jgi:hypothetical protein
MLRLDPAHPPLWRSATALQFGPDAVAVLEDPAPWQQRLIAELERGIPDASLAPLAATLGAPDRAADALVRDLAGALASPPVSVTSLALQVPDVFPGEHTAAVEQAFAVAGVELTRLTWFGAPEETVPGRAPVVVLAHHLVEPRRVAALMSADIPHLPLVLTGTGAEIGPLVIPGATPCLSCLAATRRDADPSWPLIAAQLIGRQPPPMRPALTMEAVFVAVRLITAEPPAARLPVARSVILTENSLERSIRVHRPHADCRCRSLSGIGTADDPAVLPTTTGSAIARPA